MLAHVLLSLLVSKHGFIQIRLGIFEFFNTITFLLNFTQHLSSANTFFIEEKHTQLMLGTKVKVFYESILCFYP